MRKVAKKASQQHQSLLKFDVVPSEPEKLPKAKVVLDEKRLLLQQPPPMPVSPLEVRTSSKNQYSHVEVIDPDLAKLLLEANVRNRHISQSRVQSLARDMAAGNFKLTHQGIALDREGRLIDGQHRLSAIVESNTTQHMVVTYNVEPDAFNSIDVGIQPRSIAQIASLVRGSKYASVTTAACKILWNILEENQGKSIRKQWTQSEVFNMLNVFEPDLLWVCERVSTSNQLKQAASVAAFAYAAPVARAEVEDAITKLRTRTNMTSTLAACWKAFERVGSANSHDKRMDTMTMVLRVIMLHLKGDHDNRSVFVRTEEHLNQPVFGFFRARRKKLGLLT